MHALFAYEDMGKQLIGSLKFGGARGIASWFAEGLGRQFSESGKVVDLVTWLPASQRQRRRRGFDQGQLLASALGVQLDSEVVATLRRIDRSRQTGKSRAERAQGPALRPAPGLPLEAVLGRHVLLVDDVMTTGASLTAGAGVLRRLGCADVAAVVVAYSP